MTDTFDSGQVADLNTALDGTQSRIDALTISATGFASAMSKAFTQSATGGKQFDTVLRSLALRLSSLSVTAALAPVATGITGGLSNLFSGLLGTTPPGLVAAAGAVKPFAAGGVIGTPTYFPLMSGGVGLAGEAGPEAIMPLTRGSDGQLGVAANGGGGGDRTSPSRSRRPTPTASAARKPTSPARSPARWRAANGASDASRLPRGAVSARHRAEKRGRTGAAHRYCRARLRP